VTRRYNLHINQGETTTLTVPAEPDDPTNPSSTAGLTARAQIRADPASTVVLHEWSTTDNSITLTDDKVILTLSKATSKGWTWRRGVWELELTDPGTDGTTKFIRGWVYVTPEVTRTVVA
jgi:hypothetical protein